MRSRGRKSTHHAVWSVSRGFSILELIIVIVVIGAIGAIAGQVLLQVSSSYNQERDIADTDWQARVALERMAREIRAIPTTASILVMSPGTLTFVDDSVPPKTVTFTRDPPSNTLRRQDTPPPTNHPLADYVTNLVFAYYEQTGTTAPVVTPDDVRYISIQLTVARGDYVGTFRTLVKPRNF